MIGWGGGGRRKEQDLVSDTKQGAVVILWREKVLLEPEKHGSDTNCPGQAGGSDPAGACVL
jgi:hypothetical protein